MYCHIGVFFKCCLTYLGEIILGKVGLTEEDSRVCLDELAQLLTSTQHINTSWFYAHGLSPDEERQWGRDTKLQEEDRQEIQAPSLNMMLRTLAMP